MTKRTKTDAGLPPNTIDLSMFDAKRALPRLYAYGGLTSDELDKRIHAAFRTTFAYGKAMTGLAIALPHVRDLEWLCRDYERYVATIIKYLAGDCARRIVLSLLEGRIIGRNEFALDPIPVGYQELVYCFLALVPANPLPKPITASTRLEFARPALRIGASSNSSGNRATTSFNTSTEVNNLFAGLPDHLQHLILICAGALLAIPVDDICLDPSLRRFAFTLERHLIALGHFHGDDPIDALVAFDLVRRYGTLTKRVGGAGLGQYGKEAPGPIKDIPPSECSQRAEMAIVDTARYHLGGRLLGSFQQQIDLAAVYDIGYGIIRILPDPLMNVALPVSSPAKAKQPASSWSISVSGALNRKLTRLFAKGSVNLARRLTFGIRRGHFVLSVPITETDALEVKLWGGEIGKSGMRSIAEDL